MPLNITKGQEIKPPRTMLFGVAGIGKTTFAAGFPAPIFEQTEEGADTVGCDRFPLSTTFADTIAHLSSLMHEDHDYQTIVIDSLDWLERLIFKQVAEDNAKTSIEDIGYGKGYLMALDHWRKVLDALTWLRNRKGMSVVLIAHAEIKRFDDPTNDSYDRYQPRLHAKSSAMLMEWCDCVLFANYKTFTKKTDIGFKKEVTRAVGSGDRTLYTSERPSHIAKNRYGLPAEIPMTYDAFASGIAARLAPAAVA